MLKTNLSIGFEIRELESIYYCLSQAIDRLQDLKEEGKLDNMEIGAIREIVRDARGPIGAKLHTLYSFSK